MTHNLQQIIAKLSQLGVTLTIHCGPTLHYRITAKHGDAWFDTTSLEMLDAKTDVLLAEHDEQYRRLVDIHDSVGMRP